MTLVLASTSPIRKQMLEQAGVAFEAVAADVDEASEKSSGGDPQAIAERLAIAKAQSVSRARPGDWVIGSDSVVIVEERLFDKPTDRARAAEHLRLFSGKEMRLTSAVALARDGQIEWSFGECSVLKVRVLSDAFIDSYLEAEWPDVAYCVGVFRLEGRGVQLFDSIDGSFFSILGMPLLPLLGALRERGILQS